MMKFVCEGSMKKRLTNVDTCEDLFVALEENGLLAADRTKLLLDLLSDIHREDLHQLFIPLQQPQGCKFVPRFCPSYKYYSRDFYPAHFVTFMWGRPDLSTLSLM